MGFACNSSKNYFHRLQDLTDQITQPTSVRSNQEPLSYTRRVTQYVLQGTVQATNPHVIILCTDKT